MTFPTEIHHKLNYYVYRLIDPRDGSVFYVGKGKGNRVFSHVEGALTFEGNEDEASEKIKTIRQIKNAGLEPIHVIHRHGMTDEEAFQVEAALIDATPGLTNEVAGHGSSEFGPAHASELIGRYKVEVMEVNPSHKIMTINIGRSIDENSIYQAVRCAWRISKERAEKADYIFATTQGICRDVFIAHKWLPATIENFPQRLSEDMPGRIGFVGDVAPTDIRDHYRNKRMPDHMQRTKGMASPVLYFY